MTLTWEPPRDNGGSMIIGYWLEKREKGTDYWARVNKMPVTKRGIKGWEYQVSSLSHVHGSRGSTFSLCLCFFLTKRSYITLLIVSR